MSRNVSKGIRLDRRAFSTGLAAVFGSGAGAFCAAQAQEAWPKGKPIKMIIPFAPGGATDVLGRIMAERFQQAWGTPVIVDNRSGAGGNIGLELAARSAPDGTTIVIGSVGMATNPFLYSKLGYDPVKDFDPVTLIAMVPNVLAVSKKVQANSVKELIDLIKANPGKMTYGSSGVGTSLHLAGEQFSQMIGVPMVHVPYRGAGPAKQDLLGGSIDMMFDNITSILPMVRSGDVKGLAITTAKRSVHAPELEPIAATLPGYDVSSWFAFFVPAKTPKEIITRIRNDVKTALGEPGIQQKLATLGGDAVGSTPEELAQHVQKESEIWGKLIKSIGIKAD